MAQDLKSYLERLAETYPAELVEEQEVIDPPQHEVSAYLKLLEDKGRLPAVVFRHVKNVKGEDGHE